MREPDYERLLADIIEGVSCQDRGGSRTFYRPPLGGSLVHTEGRPITP